METLNTHYRDLLVLNKNWSVKDVDFRPADKKVDIIVANNGSSVDCPDCGQACSISDHAPERQWRHLDTRQFGTKLYPKTCH